MFNDINYKTVSCTLPPVDYVDHQTPTREHLQTFLLTCGSPDRPPSPKSPTTALKPLPYAVSIVKTPCDKASTLLRVSGVLGSVVAYSLYLYDYPKAVALFMKW